MKVKVNIQSQPQGEMIEVLYLGMFANGETTEVTDEVQLEMYRSRAGLEELPTEITIDDSIKEAAPYQQPTGTQYTSSTSAPVEGSDEALAAMSKDDLLATAQARGLAATSRTTKQELLDMLKGGNT